ncbi:hypothetical protein KKA85_05160 [bacterium]|nr:hypothetical protein [bacterium]
MWTKIFLLLALWWLWRALLRLGRRSRRRRPAGSGSPREGTTRPQSGDRDLGDLTRQDISDADYEEIP